MSADWQSLPRTPFGDTPAAADQLLALVLAGTKRATSWSAADGAKGTEVGGQWVIEDGRGLPRAIVETTELFVRPFDQVDADFAAAEGEGDLSLDHWREAHRAYFIRNGGFDPEMLLYCERFKLVETIEV